MACTQPVTRFGWRTCSAGCVSVTSYYNYVKSLNYYFGPRAGVELNRLDVRLQPGQENTLSSRAKKNIPIDSCWLILTPQNGDGKFSYQNAYVSLATKLNLKTNSCRFIVTTWNIECGPLNRLVIYYLWEFSGFLTARYPNLSQNAQRCSNGARLSRNGARWEKYFFAEWYAVVAFLSIVLCKPDQVLFCVQRQLDGVIISVFSVILMV